MLQIQTFLVASSSVASHWYAVAESYFERALATEMEKAKEGLLAADPSEPTKVARLQSRHATLKDVLVIYRKTLRQTSDGDE